MSGHLNEVNFTDLLSKYKYLDNDTHLWKGKKHILCMCISTKLEQQENK